MLARSRSSLQSTCKKMVSLITLISDSFRGCLRLCRIFLNSPIARYDPKPPQRKPSSIDEGCRMLKLFPAKYVRRSSNQNHSHHTLPSHNRTAPVSAPEVQPSSPWVVFSFFAIPFLIFPSRGLLLLHLLSRCSLSFPFSPSSRPTSTLTNPSPLLSKPTPPPVHPQLPY